MKNSNKSLFYSINIKNGRGLEPPPKCLGCYSFICYTLELSNSVSLAGFTVIVLAKSIVNAINAVISRHVPGFQDAISTILLCLALFFALQSTSLVGILAIVLLRHLGQLALNLRGAIIRPGNFDQQLVLPPRTRKALLVLTGECSIYPLIPKALKVLNVNLCRSRRATIICNGA